MVKALGTRYGRGWDWIKEEERLVK